MAGEIGKESVKGCGGKPGDKLAEHKLGAEMLGEIMRDDTRRRGGQSVGKHGGKLR